MAVRKILPGMYLLPGRVNMYLLDADDGMVLIDAGFPGDEGKVFDALKQLRRPPARLRHMVLTHAHPDHIGGAAALQRATGARTCMHAADAPIAERGHGFRRMTPAPGLLPRVLFTLFSRLEARVEPVRIDQTLADGDLLPIGGGLKVIHVPGHCAGQVALLSPIMGVLFTGDVCTNVFGLGPPIGYEDAREGAHSQRKLASLDFEAACFGHGRPMLENASGRFRKAFTQPRVM